MPDDIERDPSPEQDDARHGPSLAKLRRLTNAQKFEELEAAWLDALSETRTEIADIIPIVGQVGRLGQARKADTLIELLLGVLEAREGPAVALAAARQAAAELPASSLLRVELPRLYAMAGPDAEELTPLLRDLFAGDTPLADAVAAADAYLRLRPGAFLRDPRHRDPGVVEQVDLAEGELTVRFGERRQTYERSEVPRLAILPAEHFRSFMLYRPDRLREIALARPADFVRRSIEGAKDGTLSYRDLKAQVTGLLGEKGWATWWAEARLVLRREPRLEVTGGSQPTFRLLKAGSSYEDRLRQQFSALASPAERLGLIFGYLDEASAAHPADPDLLAFLGRAVARQAMALLATEPAVALACLAAHAEIAARGARLPTPAPGAAEQVLARVGDPATLPRALDERPLRAVLDYVRAALPQRWAPVWAAVLPRAGRRLGESMARELAETGHLDALEGALREVVDRPTSSPDMLCWFWRARRASRLAETLVAMPRLGGSAVLEAMFSLVDASARLCSVSDEERHHRTLALVQQTLLSVGSAPILEIATASDAGGARRLKRMIMDNGGLPQALRAELLGVIRGTHPEVFQESEKPWEEDAIYTTPAGLEQRRQEFEHLVRVEMPAVAKAIGEAAAHGDLSENAEYKAALEKRDFITTRAAQIESELAHAKLIPADLTTSSFANIGTRVRAREEGADQDTEFVFLGPWDADPDRQVLNYSAPLAMAFMGHRPGDAVVFGEPPEIRRWRILGVEPAI